MHTTCHPTATPATKRTGRLCQRSRKTCQILQNIQVWKILPAAVWTSRPGRAGGLVFVHRWVRTKGGRGRLSAADPQFVSRESWRFGDQQCCSAAAWSMKAAFSLQVSRLSTSACRACWGSAWWMSGVPGTHLSSPPSLGRRAARKSWVSSVSQTWDLQLWAECLAKVWLSNKVQSCLILADTLE